MKILLCNKFFYNKGGAERVFFDTKKILEQNNHSVVDFSMKHPQNLYSKYQDFFVEQTELRSVKGVLKAYGNLYSFDAKRKIEKLILQEKPDIAHLHNAYFQISPSIFSVFKKYKIPVVYTVHDYHLICPNYLLFTQGSICESCKYHKYHNAIFKKCQHNNLLKSCVSAGVMTFNKIFKFYENGVTKFITPSLFMKKKLLEWKFTEQNKITVIPNSVELQVFNNSIKQQDKKYILYFGRFSKEKGIDVFVESLKKISNKNIPVKIIGDGPLKQMVLDITKDFPNVEILQHINSVNEVARILSFAKFVVLPSIVYENYPMAVVEAFASKTPVIASSVGGIQEIIKHKKNGLLFKVGDSNALAKCIDLLLNDDILAELFGIEGQKFVNENNSQEMYYKRLMDVYNEVLEK